MFLRWAGTLPSRRGGGFTRKVTALLALVALASAQGWVVASPAGATIIPVTTTLDGGAGSLRQAFLTASGNGQDNTIVLQALAEYDLTCVGGGQLSYTGANALTIQGSGATIKQTCPTNRVIADTAAAQLTFDTVIITGGSTAGAGGGVSAAGPVKVTKSIFNANTGGSGGAIATSGDVTADTTSFGGNTATIGAGGAVAAGGNVDVSFSSFSTNTAGTNGGAIQATQTIRLENSNLSSNQAAGAGGAASGGTSVVIGFSNVSGNTAGASGGGVDSGTTTATNDSNFSTNTAAATGGAIHAAGSVTVNTSNFSQNHATNGAGGAIQSGGVVQLTTANLDQNSAGTSGGGVDAAAAVSVDGSTFSTNRANGTGGGAINTPGTVTVTNSTFDGNRAQTQGGSINTGASTALVYATVTGGAAPNGANVIGPLTSYGSVLAFPQGGTSCAGGSATTQGFNFTDDTSCQLAGATDRPNAGDPQLGALGFNGGITPTRLPLPGSPLIAAIPIAGCRAGIATDQRGAPRPSVSGCTIGAVEVSRPIPRFTG